MAGPDQSQLERYYRELSEGFERLPKGYRETLVAALRQELPMRLMLWNLSCDAWKDGGLILQNLDQLGEKLGDAEEQKLLHDLSKETFRQMIAVLLPESGFDSEDRDLQDRIAREVEDVTLRVAKQAVISGPLQADLKRFFELVAAAEGNLEECLYGDRSSRLVKALASLFLYYIEKRSS